MRGLSAYFFIMTLLLDLLLALVVAIMSFMLFLLIVTWITPEDERKANKAFIDKLSGKTPL